MDCEFMGHYFKSVRPDFFIFAIVFDLVDLKFGENANFANQNFAHAYVSGMEN